MSRFEVHAVWLVEGPKVVRGTGLLSGSWPSGLVLSHYDGRVLTVVAEVRARTEDDARALVAGRVVLAWQDRTGQPLGGPDRVRVRRRDRRDAVAAGIAGRRRRRPDLSAGSVRSFPDRAVGADAPLLPGTGLVVGPWPDERPDGPDERPDDGGLAGVREPRRPGPGPGSLSARAVPPAASPETRFFTGLRDV